MKQFWFAVGFCLVLGVAAGQAAPEKIPSDKVVHPVMTPVSAPEILSETRKDPAYPEKWRDLHLAARVIVQVVVDKSGSITHVDPLQTKLWVETDCGEDSGGAAGKEAEGTTVPVEASRDFEVAAIKAVKRWKFRPGTMSGVPVDVYYTLTVNISSCTKKADAGSPPSR